MVEFLWGSGPVASAVPFKDRWASAVAEDCVYEDLYDAEPTKGRAAVLALRQERALPPGAHLVIDRVSDGWESCGFTWHLEQDGAIGQRGLNFLRLDRVGRVCYVREVAEPLFKAGVLTEQLLQALTKDQKPPQKTASQQKPEETPRTAGGIVRYLYGTVQQSGGDAVRFFADDVVYEDMNYEQPFVGKPAVAAFLGRFQAIQGVTFALERVSDGERAVGFTYHIDVAGQPRGIRGATFYEVDAAGKVCYVRDIPESPAKPPPLQFAARLLRPGLRRLAPASPLPGDVAGGDKWLAAAPATPPAAKA